MEVERHDGRIQRKIVIAMVTSPEVLSRIAPKWGKDGLFESQWCNIIGRWCVNHWNKYGKPPNKAIQHRFDSYAEKSRDKDTVKMIERFLSSLSAEHSQNGDANHDYLIDLAAEHFNTAAAKRTQREMEQEIDNGKIREAIAKANALQPIDLGTGGTVDVLFDEEAIRRVFAEKKESIIKFPGALGQFFGRSLTRDAFIAFVGPEKSGKSFWLLELAWAAMLARLKVAMFVIGDMSEDQVMERFVARASKRPIVATRRDEWVCYPKKIERDKKSNEAVVLTCDKQYKQDLDWREALQHCRAITQTEIKSKTPLLKLKCYPGGNITASGIHADMQAFTRQGFVPDVCVVDYADNIAGTDSRIDTRHQINATWRDLRSISQIFHCLLVTATQANAKAYKQWVMGPENFSESKMKNAQVTGMIGINQSDTEKDNDITRLNWIERRGEAFSRRRCVYIAGCRPIANIAVRSCW